MSAKWAKQSGPQTLESEGGVVRVKGYLALYTEAAFEQRVPHRSLGRATRQTKI